MAQTPSVDDPHILALRDKVLPMALLLMQNVLIHIPPNDGFKFDIPYIEFATALTSANSTNTLKV